LRISLTYILLSVSVLFGIPKFSIQNGSSCGLCHINPTGGALRNDHGTEIVSMDELPRITDGSFYPNDYTGMINDHIRFGGDFRIQEFSYKPNDQYHDVRYHAFIPMQSEIYAFVTPSSAFGFFLEIDLNPNGSGSEYWGLINGLPMNGWLKFGRSLPNYGLRLDDHSSFIRNGSISQNYGLPTNQMPFSPFTQKPLLLELGINPFRNILWTFSYGNGIYSSGNSGKHLLDKNMTTRMQYAGTLFNVQTLFALQGMIESDRNLWGLSNRYCSGPITWESELDWILNTDDYNLISLNVHHQLSLDIFTGISLNGTYEFIDPDLDTKSGSITRTAVGINYFPIPFLEIKFQTRFHQTENINIEKSEPEYIFQIHTWF